MACPSAKLNPEKDTAAPSFSVMEFKKDKKGLAMAKIHFV